MLHQRTLRGVASGEGIGLHLGVSARFAICPAPPDTGIVFVRSDLARPNEIPATVAHVVSSRLSTTLGRDGVSVQTVEHVLAALYGLGIDNAFVEVGGPEVPILDGSAREFVRRIRETGGTLAQRRPKRFVVVRRAVEVRDGERRIARIEPASAFRVRCDIEFDHPLVDRQSLEIAVSDVSFVDGIADARTFGFARDLDAMRRDGYALGGTLENAVLIDDFSVRNPEGFRFADECVRHKMLDALGDLALLGAPLVGRFIGTRTSHALNAALVRALLADERAWKPVELRRRSDVAALAIHLPTFRVRRFARA